MSPRRRRLLSLLVEDFDVRPAAIDETPLRGEHPRDLAIRLARLKASAVYSTIDHRYRVLGGDTVVAIGEQALGKPVNTEQARTMLRALSGRSHQVFSAMAICEASGIRHVLSESVVTFRKLTDLNIETYCATDDPYDKAGGYGIQGGAGAFVVNLEGSYSGVVGLPLWHTHQLLFPEAQA